MSGHSKWHNIQAKKGKADAARGKIFTKLGRELLIAVKQGGPDPAGNSKLKDVIAKCKANNMPNDTINNAIKKASGAGSNESYEEITYEGYGPGGVAVMVSALTDNKNRTASAVRSAFSHSGGSLGASGSVSYMFDRKGLIEILRDGLDKSEDDMLMDALDAGAEDMKATEEKFQIFTDPSSMTDVRDALQEQGYELDTAEVTMIPQNRTEVPADKAKQYRHLIDELTENDDVADIYETGILPDEDDDEE